MMEMVEDGGEGERLFKLGASCGEVTIDSLQIMFADVSFGLSH
jgi:hypothetical protein